MTMIFERRAPLAGIIAAWVGLCWLAGGQSVTQPVGGGGGAGLEVSQVGRIEKRSIKESSGLVASRRYPGVLWTHNDGGGRARQVLYAMDHHGKSLGEFSIRGLSLSDWEDLAIDGSGHLYIGDIGNNDRKRSRLVVFQIEEPDPKLLRVQIRPQQSWQLEFPGTAFDCESLFVVGGNGYVISKVFDDEQAEIFRFSLEPQASSVVLQWVVRLPITSPVTAADVSADGAVLGVVCKAGAYAFKVDGVVERAGSITPWQTKFRRGQIEGCCFVPEGLLASSESREIFLFSDAAFRR